MHQLDLEKITNEEYEKSIKFKKSRTWLDDEHCFETMYDFSFLERNDLFYESNISKWKST